MQAEVYRSLKHNLFANLMDGAFFGFALGFASFVTIVPLFVSTMTDSAVLIGFIPAIHSIGWQLPQLWMAKRVASQRQIRPMVLRTTLHERLPFLALALIAWEMPHLGTRLTLLLTFTTLVWQGLGGGFTANAWQSMIGKIIPSERRGTFFGAQSAVANVLSSVGAVLAGIILERWDSPQDFSLNFLLAGVCMVISFLFLSRTREPESLPVEMFSNQGRFRDNLRGILQRDRNFSWFLVARMLSQLSVMAFAFYTVYVVRQHGLSELQVGVMTAVLLASQVIVNPVIGWVGDRFSHLTALQIGAGAATLSALVAWWAPSAAWFYLVFTLAGVANAAIWTVSLAIIQEFGQEAERPAYIGLGNTLVAPATVAAPFLGGWLAEAAGYPAAFMASVLCGAATLVVLALFVRDPRHVPKPASEAIPGD